ncbi:6-bladed beta-propeller [Parabacteroides sp. OttesenSCG-928-G21]|nr:6-bladed beta-propeller [Parabacteroides sp. OttesenSCG-928-G21]
MKRVNTLMIFFLFILAGCGENQQSTDDFITVDVTKSYPKKELILQDFMDVEYIPLETNDEFINRGFVQAIGKEIILVRNRNDDGDIFVYDRTGKALRKINRKGQGGEEYASIYNITLDEDKGEMFVSDIYSKKIIVYDLYGNFKRSFKHKEGSGSQFYTDIFNYDQDNLICYDSYNKEIAFILISKQDGSITREIETPFNEKLFLRQQLTDEAAGMVYTYTPGPYRTISPYDGSWFLTELSSDTVYTLSPDNSLQPFLVRTPSIHSMDPGVFLVVRLFSDRYYFMETIKNAFDWETRTGFAKDFFIYDKQENSFSGYILYNGDYSTKKELDLSLLKPVNHEIESWQFIDAYQLVEDYENGYLKGELKEIASTLDEEDNPVIMLVKHKK